MSLDNRKEDLLRASGPKIKTSPLECIANSKLATIFTFKERIRETCNLHELAKRKKWFHILSISRDWGDGVNMTWAYPYSLSMRVGHNFQVETIISLPEGTWQSSPEEVWDLFCLGWTWTANELSGYARTVWQSFLVSVTHKRSKNQSLVESCN